MNNYIKQWINQIPPATPSAKVTAKVVPAIFVCMLLIGLISKLVTPELHSLILVASTGASIILVFMLHSSPLSQPYPLLMGHFICAIIGVACSYLPLETYLTATICVASCIAAMSLFRCAHPPGGATAMMPILVGPEAVGGFDFVIFPVMLNMLLLLIMGWLFHRYWLKNTYPVRTLAKGDPVHKIDDETPLSRLGVNADDLRATLKDYGAFLDVSEQDLVNIVGLAQQKAYTRKFGEIRCADIMSRDMKFVRADTDLEQAWALLRKHKVKLLPVVDDDAHVIGIVSLVDFLKRADLKNYDGFALRLENYIKGDVKMKDNPRKVRQIMNSPVFTVGEHELIASMVPLLSDQGLHHIPVVNEYQELVGIITQSDLIAALYNLSV